MIRFAFRACMLALIAAGSSLPAATVALVGGRLIDGFGGPPLANSVILIEGERIKAIGQVGKLAVPAGAEVISTEGMDLLPGLWDAHVHTMLLGHSNYEHWDKTYPSRFGSEIMPAAARQLLLAGVTSARDLGAPLKESIEVRDRINRGEIPGPTLYVSGPFIQHEPYPGTEAFRWGVKGADDARAKVRKLADAGVNIIKLIDQDQMTMEEVKAVVDEAHKRKLPVVAHGHRPEEIRRGLAAGADCFEHTGLATAPGYPDDVLAMIAERTAKMSLGPLFWCPTIEGFLNYEPLLQNPEQLDDPAWQEGVPADIVADIKASIAHPGQNRQHDAGDSVPITKCIADIDAAVRANKAKTLSVIVINTDVAATTLEQEKARTGFSFGEIYVAHSLALATRKKFDTIVKLKKSGKTWEKIAQEHNVTLKGSRELIRQIKENQ